jgi:hypothetical protein
LFRIEIFQSFNPQIFYFFAPDKVESFEVLKSIFLEWQSDRRKPQNKKKISRRELATNSWNRHINLFIPKKRWMNETFLKFVRLTSYSVQK